MTEIRLIGKNDCGIIDVCRVPHVGEYVSIFSIDNGPYYKVRAVVHGQHERPLVIIDECNSVTRLDILKGIFDE